MTILQHYLASIGVISLSNTRSGKYPSLGSGYPSSSSSQFFHTHTAQMAVAAAAAAGKSGHAAVSPSPSNQYDMYDEEQQEQEQQVLQQQQQEYEQVLAYQQHAAAAAAAECEEEHQQHYGQQYGYEQQYSEHTAAGAATGDAECEGAAAGLLQLARAALMHLEEEEEEEADGSAGIKQEADDADMQEDAAGSGLERAQAQLRQLRASSSRQSGRHAAGSGPWGKPELLPVMRSNSEDSDHTAEEEEGSPMAEANLKLQLQQALRPSSSSLAKGKRSPQGGNGLAGSSMPGSKRHRPMWQHPASTAAGTAAPARLRPVLDVSSEPAGSSYGGAHSLAGGEASPASPAARGSSSPAAAGGSGMLGAPEPHAQLLALMMQAFMGAAAAGAASNSAEGELPAAALSANHLAAVARIMQISGLAAGPAAAGSLSSGAAAGSNAAVADMLAAMMQGDAAAGGAHAAAAWSSSLEQHVRAAAGQ
jgi:hypothetical protein